MSPLQLANALVPRDVKLCGSVTHVSPLQQVKTPSSMLTRDFGSPREVSDSQLENMYGGMVFKVFGKVMEVRPVQLLNTPLPHLVEGLDRIFGRVMEVRPLQWLNTPPPSLVKEFGRLIQVSDSH